VYTVVLDYGHTPKWISKVDIIGTSSGYWCEEGQRGGSYCHNDNGFKVAFSVDGKVWSDWNPGATISLPCGKLDNGCGWEISPRKIRYMKMEVRSGCHGCSNNDYVDTIKLTKASATYEDVIAIRTALNAQQGNWLSPLSVKSASCKSSGTHGGEPAGTCQADETDTAEQFLQGGETNIRAASGGSKTYSFIYDLGTDRYVNELQLEGRSTGFWCEDGDRGGSYCHNDNGFSVTFSVDGTTFTAPPNPSTTDACGKLDDGCGWTFSPMKARYFNLRAQSGCPGCVNNDFITAIRIKEAYGATELIQRLEENDRLMKLLTERLITLEKSGAGKLNVIQSGYNCKVTCGEHDAVKDPATLMFTNDPHNHNPF
jgi:hypothetical protein